MKKGRIIAIAMIAAAAAAGISVGTVKYNESRIEAQNAAAAAEVDSLIDKIGDVTIDSGDAIKKAEGAYDKLTDEEKGLVTKHDALLSARGAYDALVQERSDAESLAKDIEALDIESLTADSSESIKGLRSRYDGLPDEAKSYVGDDDAKKLSDAEEKVASLIAEANEAAEDAQAKEKAASDKAAKESARKAASASSGDTGKDTAASVQDTASAEASAPADTSTGYTDSNGYAVSTDQSTSARTVTSPAGYTITYNADGSKTKTDADGYTCTTYPDGSALSTFPDGRYARYDANYNVIDSNIEFKNDVVLGQ